ncbi:hypothetical protein [Paenibacillus sp. NPDC058071]|uniref:hypothetical protein n=1 Tax=Paenibacillus sp. NPDC058071 TaxID=3346326 RepID=UPI0036DA76DB
MKIRIVPVLITAAAAAVLLFGSWFIYNRMVIEKPLNKAIQNIAGISSADEPVLGQGRVSLRLTLGENADLKQVYEQINEQGKDVIGKKELDLQIANAHSNDRLDKLWSGALFDIAQAMETKSYSNIPKTMNGIAKQNEGVQAVTDMDDHNVYITLKDGKHYKHVVLPRTPVMLEVSARA